MPAITDRSNTTEPVLKTKRLNHGTLACADIARTRQFYEEVLGLDVVQSSPVSLMVSKGSRFVYAVVEMPGQADNMHMLNHNGFEVDTPEEVAEAHRAILAVKDRWGLKVLPPKTLHGSMGFYFRDFDNNWWEVVSAGERGYWGDFEDPDYDLTGAHAFNEWSELFAKTKQLKHMSDPLVRDQVRTWRESAR